MEPLETGLIIKNTTWSEDHDAAMEFLKRDFVKEKTGPIREFKQYYTCRETSMTAFFWALGGF